MEVLEKALKWANENYSNAPNQNHCAFANSVQYLVTGWSGGYGGPSAREHAVSYASAGVNAKNMALPTGLTVLFPDGTLPAPGEWKFDQACKFAAPLCFGQITELHFKMWRQENCFDDSEEDIKALKFFRVGNA